MLEGLEQALSAGHVVECFRGERNLRVVWIGKGHWGWYVGQVYLDVALIWASEFYLDDADGEEVGFPEVEPYKQGSSYRGWECLDQWVVQGNLIVMVRSNNQVILTLKECLRGERYVKRAVIRGESVEQVLDYTAKRFRPIIALAKSPSHP